jgi:hypothetical protein
VGTDPGAAFEVQDAQGVGIMGDGRMPAPDGTWKVESGADVSPGQQYRVLATCTTSDGRGFRYEPVTVSIP